MVEKEVVELTRVEQCLTRLAQESVSLTGAHMLKISRV